MNESWATSPSDRLCTRPLSWTAWSWQLHVAGQNVTDLIISVAAIVLCSLEWKTCPITGSFSACRRLRCNSGGGRHASALRANSIPVPTRSHHAAPPAHLNPASFFLKFFLNGEEFAVIRAVLVITLNVKDQLQMRCHFWNL